MENNLLGKGDHQRQYRAAGIVIFAMSVLVLLARIIVFFTYDLVAGMDEFLGDFVIDVIFSVIVQVLILFVMPLLVYKILLKMSVKKVFSFSNFRKTKPVNLLLALAIGSLGIVVTIGISFAWQIILIIFGYMPPNSSSVLPEEFNIWIFLGSMILTAVLPGFCEEFTMRGGFLTTLRSALPMVSVITVSALAFGLFHQSIIQTFYTACFGALMAFVTIRTKSIFPAMIIHFVNNGLSVYLTYAEGYDWFGGGFYSKISDMMLSGQFLSLMLIYLLVCAIFALLVYLLAKINPSDTVMPVMLDGNPPQALAATYGMGNLDQATVKKSPPLEINPKIAPKMLIAHQPNNSYAANQLLSEERIVFVNKRYYLLKNSMLYPLRPKMSFRPNLADNVLFIGAIVVSALSTLFTLVFGFIM